jgi:serine/threonine protein kinase
MEYIDGETLEDVITSGQPLLVAEVVAIALTLCSVLSYLHAQTPPIVFRDLKPANIMPTRAGQLYLIDFGIARRYIEGKYRDTRLLGTPGYAAPEQYGTAQTTIQTDIYGLGTTLLALLTGKDPQDVQSVRNNEQVPVGFRALLAQMLEYDPGKRPQGIDAVKKQLLALM